MANITRWDPFSELADMRRTMDALFDDVRPARSGVFQPSVESYFPVDLYETKDEVVVEASLPGVKPEDIDISVTGQLVTVKGEAKDDHEEKAENFYRHERRHGTFVRQFSLPTEVDADKAQANFEHGVLELRLPKSESMKPKSIKINGASAKVIDAKASGGEGSQGGSAQA
jgi:HSP20 family protein